MGDDRGEFRVRISVPRYVPGLAIRDTKAANAAEWSHPVGYNWPGLQECACVRVREPTTRPLPQLLHPRCSLAPAMDVSMALFARACICINQHLGRPLPPPPKRIPGNSPQSAQPPPNAIPNTKHIIGAHQRPFVSSYPRPPGRLSPERRDDDPHAPHRSSSDSKAVIWH